MKRYVESISLKTQPDPHSYLAGLPVVRSLGEQPLRFTSPVTFFVGENGSGKSTLLEAIAVALGFNPEGGSKNIRFATEDTHSPLWKNLRVTRSAAIPRDGFFLRAESLYNLATSLDHLDDPRSLLSYGGESLHEQSHGESFLNLVQNRFGGWGLYLLDEPEAALSPARQLSLLLEMNRLVRTDSQLIIATHSPILMAYPGAQVVEITEDGFCTVPYRETDHYRIMKLFLDDPERMMKLLFEGN